MEGWRVASKRLAALPRRRRSALAHGCGRGGRGALPLPRAAAVSTRLRVHVQVARPAEREQRVAQRLDPLVPAVYPVVVWDEDAQQCAVQLACLLGAG